MKNKKYTFMVSILSLFGALTLILSFFLIFNFYTRGLNNAYEILNEKNTEITNNISETIVSSLKSVENQLNILSKITTSNNIMDDFDSISKVTWEQLQADTNIASIFLADENGNFIQARRLPQFAIRHINAVDGKQLDIWDYKNESFDTTSIHFKKVNYDPRTRVWYQELKLNQRVYWSDPYLFASTGTPGITIAVGDFNQFNKKMKVAAADFTLDTLSNILKEKALLLNGEILMFNESKDIIASSLQKDEKSSEKKILSLHDLKESKYEEVYENLSHGKFNGEITHNNKEYIYFITKLPQITGKNWYISSIIQKELIVSDIKMTMLKTVFIGLLIMIITYFPIQFILKRFVIEPIQDLEYMTNEIAHNRFENIKPTKTMIYEFYQLSNSMVTMSHAIQKYELDQKNLIDSFIKILAESIDAKSPYTGGHCERVPVIAKMLVNSASSSKEGIFKDFQLTTEDEIREFEIAAWLHDCGKVVTPEYVVDKATKLETIYNRIHEIRTRFEVLHRDATIEYYQQLINNPQQKEALEKRLEEQHKKLQDDFAFLAQCNIGGEFMDDAKIERLKEIANITWIRNFDDRIGLSQAELLRVETLRSITPQIEKLLSDKPEHIINRERDIDAIEYEKYKFKVDIPENAYNMGELYNMCIKRGTLNQEERFKINEHIIMTIKMLEQLPFTSNLKNVPEYAGSHHETMIGSGYPRKLSKEEISIPARIMAIADIFEALTACDRPYKKAKTLSESIKIMSFMVKDGHIDGDLFKLFLTSGNYLEYANTYLKAEQIDEVDITTYL
jgi:HD-GYP domain-containing protein (c-di-GMP phosphodiesterase class II)